MSNLNANTPEGSYRLVNAYEEVIYSTVRRLMSKDGEICTCEKCFLDVCALVFNNNFCRFVTTPKGEMLARVPELTDNRDAELCVAVLEAIKLVKAHPAH